MLTEKIKTYQQQVLDFVNSISKERISQLYLISYGLLIDEINFHTLIKHFEKDQKDYFYYSKPEQDFFILNLGESLSFSFENVEQLNGFNSEFIKVKNNILNNFNEINLDPPLFFFTAKFPSVKTSEEWKSFESVKLFIPEIVLIKDESKTLLIVNIRVSSLIPEYVLAEQIISKINYFQNSDNSFSYKKLNNKINLLSKQDFSDWKHKVEKVLSGITNRKYDKVVLSRRTEFKFSEQISEADLALILDYKYPECFNFLYKINDSLFFSASPEKLFIIKNGDIFTEALAGSIERGKNDIEDKELETALTSSSKDVDEHKFVIDHLKSVLQAHCNEVIVDNVPSLKKLTNIQHLHTGLSAKINNELELFQLIKDIFPTPAVGGYPIRPTLEVIDQIEDFDRGLFTGFVGWLTQKNDGEFIVAIRSGLINRSKLYVYAGCGIVKDSDPKREFEETQLKSEAIISLFKYENED